MKKPGRETRHRSLVVAEQPVSGPPAARLAPDVWIRPTPEGQNRDRRRTPELFGFDYQLEMYKPAPKALANAVRREIRDLARWLDVDQSVRD